jgi:hypothetical protein
MLYADNGSAMSVVLITSPAAAGKTLTAATWRSPGQVSAPDLPGRRRHAASAAAPAVRLADGPSLRRAERARDAQDALVTLEITRSRSPRRAPRRPAELGTAAMRRTIETLRSRFDRIVVTRPRPPLADVGILRRSSTACCWWCAPASPSNRPSRRRRRDRRAKLLGVPWTEAAGHARDSGRV